MVDREQVPTDAYDVQARELPEAQRDAVFEHVTATVPGFADYQDKTERVIPVFELRRS